MRLNLRLVMVVTILVLMGLGSACRPAPATQTTTITPTVKPTPLLRVDLKSIPPVTLQPPLPWKVEFVQGDKVVQEQDGAVRLARQPFTIRATLPQALPVMLNVLDNDSNYQATHAGLHTDCPIPFCIGGGMVEDDFTLPTSLVTGTVNYHYLVVDAQERYYRWNRATVTRDGIVLERDVMLIDNIPLEQFRKAKLYLLFFVDYRDKEQIDEDELLKFVLVFQ
jgi:hypothetical protein